MPHPQFAGLHRARPFKSDPRAQQGYNIIELGAVLIIVAVLASIAVPRIQGILIEARIPASAQELQRYMYRAKALGEGSTNTPFSAIDNADNLAPAMRASTVFKVNGSTVAHKLGGAGTGSAGTITVAPAALAGGSLGSAFSLTLTNVSRYACPMLATSMNAASETISINGNAAKSLGANNEPGTYNPVAAEALCNDGETNTFVFASR